MTSLTQDVPPAPTKPAEADTDRERRLADAAAELHEARRARTAATERWDAAIIRAYRLGMARERIAEHLHVSRRPVAAVLDPAIARGELARTR